MTSNFIFTLVFVLHVFYFACSSTNLKSRKLSSLNYTKENAEVFLIYKRSPSHVTIKQCEDFSTLEDNRDCKLKEGKEAFRIYEKLFEKSLKFALGIDIQGLENSHKCGKNAVYIYVNRNNYDIAELRKENHLLNSQIKKIKRFLLENPNSNAGPKLEKNIELLRVNSRKIDEFNRLNDVKICIDDKIANLVEQVKENDITKISSSSNSFFYNIIKSYMRISRIFSSMKYIPKGNFWMGTDERELYLEYSSDLSRRQVRLERSYEIMDTEVTQIIWYAIMGNNPSQFKRSSHCPEEHEMFNSKTQACPNHPVENVSWNDVSSFTRRLNSELQIKDCLGRPNDPEGCYRLPTSAEWEYATRRDTLTYYYFGDSWYSVLGDHAWFRSNSEGQTHPVAQKDTNSFGLYDVYGNVAEWIYNLYKARDGTLYRFIRGGSFKSAAASARSASHKRGHQEKGYSNTGFRLVKNALL